MTSLIKDYNDNGPSVLSHYLQQDGGGGDVGHDDDDTAIYTEIDQPERKVVHYSLLGTVIIISCSRPIDLYEHRGQNTLS